MDQYAIISINGTQQKVSVGDTVKVRGELSGEDFTFDKVHYVSGDTPVMGSPFVSNASVTGKVKDSYKGPKVRVASFRAKSKYHKVKGYRDLFTLVQITGIKTS